MKNKIDVVFEILFDEVRGDIKSALEKMSKDYSMTWMYQGKRELFPLVDAKQIKKAMNEAYVIKRRVYNIYNYVEQGDVVFLELIESYSVKKEVYKTPLVLVIYFDKQGNIKLGRHYCDPKIYNNKKLTPQVLNRAYKKQKIKVRISEKGIEKY